jgi:hypothetical protein
MPSTARCRWIRSLTPWQKSKAATRIIILDACRTNPWERKWHRSPGVRGLASGLRAERQVLAGTGPLVRANPATAAKSAADPEAGRQFRPASAPRQFTQMINPITLLAPARCLPSWRRTER